MTIEFYKNKKHAKLVAKEIRKFTRKNIRVSRVRVSDIEKLRNAGGRKYNKKGTAVEGIKSGEVGYVISFRGMKKTGLQITRRKR